VVLDATAPDETSFTTVERTMLRNILDLHERRIADVMVPRGDIVAVKRDISLGELMSLFESAAHSRLVVYNDTLDDPEGFVHIRDLLGFMTSKAKVDDEVNAKRKKPFPAGLDLRSVDLRMKLADANIMRKLIYVPPSMPAIDLLAQCRPRAFIWHWWSMNTAAPTGWSRSRTLSSRWSARSTTNMTATKRPLSSSRPDGSFIADARASLEDVQSVVGEEFDTGEAGEDVDTLGGYLVTQVGRLPVRGEIIAGPGDFEIEVLDADPRRVKRVRIGTHKDRSNLRHRELRRREAAADAAQAQANDPANPASSSDGTGSR
jgi:CBS domain containing-hemolysin-like protein